MTEWGWFAMFVLMMAWFFSAYIGWRVGRDGYWAERWARPPVIIRGIRWLAADPDAHIRETV